MKLSESLETLGSKKALRAAKDVARQYEIEWGEGIETVLKAICASPGIAPTNVKASKDGSISAIEKWVLKYSKGYEGRASQRISNAPGTTADPIIDSIIGGRLTHLDEDDLENIKFAHRLGMSAENILGLILEEYLAENLSDSGWHCAWGETARSIDFIKNNGEMLQVKNRSNSENSSSVRVRAGTEIQKWHRVDAKTGAYQWASLNEMCGIESLSEANFVEFVKDLLSKNPGAMAVEEGNTWLEEE